MIRWPVIGLSIRGSLMGSRDDVPCSGSEVATERWVEAAQGRRFADCLSVSRTGAMKAALVAIAVTLSGCEHASDGSSAGRLPVDAIVAVYQYQIRNALPNFSVTTCVEQEGSDPPSAVLAALTVREPHVSLTSASHCSTAAEGHKPRSVITFRIAGGRPLDNEELEVVGSTEAGWPDVGRQENRYHLRKQGGVWSVVGVYPAR
jgi:hypothetical protein